MRRSIVALTATLAGCYLSHTTDDAGRDAGFDAGPPDIGVDAPPDIGCAAPYTFCARLCASPDTPIATPDGEQPIAELQLGSLVYSMDHGAVRLVPVVWRVRNEAHDHAVVHVRLASGRTLEISPGHPTADGRTFADLAPGGMLGGVSVLEVEMVPYSYDATYDILPASDTGTYFAAGVLVGSTLFTPGP